MSEVVSDPGGDRQSPEGVTDGTQNVLSTSGPERPAREVLLRPLPANDVTLIPIARELSIADIRQHFPTGPVVVCDFYVTDIEKGDAVAGGFERDGIITVDHHAPRPEMYRGVSSGVLARDYVEANGVVPSDVPVVIHHTDCDSVIGSLILRGYLPPSEEYLEAVIAADHTGVENEIADLLQAIDPIRDLDFSASNLQKLLRGEALDEKAQAMLDVRMDERRRIEGLVERGEFQQIGDLILVTPSTRIAGELIPPYFPEASLVLSIAENTKGEGWVVKGRLGAAAPDGFTLFESGLFELDERFGGRWNAGSNSRGGGTLIAPQEYAERLARGLSDRLANYS